MTRRSAQSLKVSRDLAGEKLLARQFVELCKQRGLPAPTLQYEFAKADGRKWRLDFAWIEQRVGIEVHGGIFVRGAHSRGAQQLKDFEKMNALQARLWSVYQTIPRELCTAPTLDFLRIALTLKGVA